MDTTKPEKKDDATEAIYMILGVMEGSRSACNKRMNEVELGSYESAKEMGRMEAYENSMKMVSGLLPIIDVFVRTNAGHMDVIEQQFNTIKEQSKRIRKMIRETLTEEEAEEAKLDNLP